MSSAKVSMVCIRICLCQWFQTALARFCSCTAANHGLTSAHGLAAAMPTGSSTAQSHMFALVCRPPGPMVVQEMAHAAGMQLEVPGCVASATSQALWTAAAVQPVQHSHTESVFYCSHTLTGIRCTEACRCRHHLARHSIHCCTCQPPLAAWRRCL